MATKTRTKKTAKPLVIDFTPEAKPLSRVWMRRRTNSYLHLRDEDGEGVFLTMDSGSITVARLPLVQPDTPDGHHTYRVWFSREDYEDLEPWDYDFDRALEKYHSSLIGRTAGAEREMRKLRGMPELAAGVTDQDLAVSRPERKRSRKGPSEASEKQPGGYTLQALCEDLGIEPVEARKYLRQQKAEKPGGRWEWTSPEAAASIRSMLETMPKE